MFWALELVTDRDSKEPLAPYGSSSPAMDELAAACRARGLLPFTNYNRLHVVPPCTVSVEEAQEGLAILDEALAVADRPLHRFLTRGRENPGPKLRQARSATVVDAQQAGRH